MTVGDCSQGALWLELAKGIPTALATALVGSIATYVAWRQHLTARAKLKLDLFEKRYAIFEQTWAYLSEILQTGPGENVLSSFDNVIPQAGFLFGHEVEAYLRDASAKRSELWLIGSRTKAGGDVMPPEDIERHTELMNWFYAQASEGAKKIFGPYLDFEDWK